MPTETGRVRVLVVDDDPGMQRVLVIALREEGYECATARDGIEALQAASAIRPDLIVLDLRMPRMGGVEFVQVYRALPGPHAPIVVFSALEDPDLHGVVFTPRPCDLDEFLDLVRTVLERAPPPG